MALRFGVEKVPVRVQKTLGFSVLFFCGIVLHSIIFSRMTDVSVLKAVSWMMAIGSLIIAWGGLHPQIRHHLSRQVFWLLAIVMLLSMPLILSPIGFMVNGTGFQGILSHPQAFGAVMCLLAAWAGSSMLAEKKPTWLMISLFSLACIMILMSEARTGALSLTLGLAVAALTVSSLSGRAFLSLAPGLKSNRVQILAVAGFIALGLSWSVVSDRMGDFFSKRTESQSLAEAYETSRGALIEVMLTNVKQDPLIGIGFGIGSVTDEMVVVREPLLDLPVSAIVEKGVLPIAVLEEIGVIGLLAALILFFSIVRNSSYGGLTPLAVCLTALLTNMGDSMFFSTSGMGLILIILVAWSATFANSPAPK